MIGMGISSLVLVQIRSESSATWDLVGADKPFGFFMKTPFCSAGIGIGNITHQTRPNSRPCFKSWPLLALLCSVVVSQGSSTSSSQGHGGDIPAYEQSYAHLLCMARTAGRACNWEVVCHLLDPKWAL